MDDSLVSRLAEKAVKCEKCKFVFSVAAFKEHTCAEKENQFEKNLEAEHRYYVDGRIVTRKFVKAGDPKKSKFKFKCEDCENWYCYEALDIHHCFKDTETFRPNKNGKYQCDVCDVELPRSAAVRHYKNFHHR